MTNSEPQGSGDPVLRELLDLKREMRGTREDIRTLERRDVVRRRRDRIAVVALAFLLVPAVVLALGTAGFVVKTFNGTSDVSRLTIESGDATANAYFENSVVGIGTATPRSALDTYQGVVTGAGNDYEKAQFTMSGGGTVTWAGGGGKLKWTTRFIAIPVQRPNTASAGYINFTQPTVDIPAGQVHSGVARTADANGVVLNAWEALYGVHTVGGGVGVTYYIVIYTANFNPPSNWLLVAAVNGDDNSVKLGNGVTLWAGGTWYAGDPYVNTAGDTMTGALALSGGVTGAAPSPQITMGSYIDNSGAPSASHLALWSTLYGFGVTGGDLDYMSDQDHRWHSDTVEDAMYLDADAGNLTTKGQLNVGNGTIAAGIVIDDIASGGVSPTVTQAAAGSVFGGAASNADAWHTHSATGGAWTFAAALNSTEAAATTSADTFQLLSGVEYMLLGVWWSVDANADASTGVTFTLSENIYGGHNNYGEVGWDGANILYGDLERATALLEFDYVVNGWNVGYHNPESSAWSPQLRSVARVQGHYGYAATATLLTVPIRASGAGTQYGYFYVRYDGVVRLYDQRTTEDVACIIYKR